MTLSDPNPGFKVTVRGSLKVEYLADGAAVFIVQNTVDHWGLYRKRAKNWGRR